MSKIIVFNVPAVSGGALTILNKYYEEAINDTKNEYVFVVSTPKLGETKNVRVLNYPWVKKSWFHRLWFDMFIAKKIVKKENPDEIMSLQNTYIKNKKNLFQTIYMHQPLPYTDIKFSLFKEPKLWVYRNVIGKIINKSLKKVDKIIVQTNWVKDAIIKR